MQIKDSVKVGAMNYKITYTDENIILDNQLCKGTIDYENLIITISNNIANQRKEETFIHEVLHGIVRERNLVLEDEEMIVDEISKGLYQVLKDNPGIFNK